MTQTAKDISLVCIEDVDTLGTIMNKPLSAYYQQFNKRFYKLLPLGMKRVLEFGCSAGVLGKAYKEANSDCIWHGVEIVAEAAELAKQNIDQVWVMNADKLKPNQTMLEQPYDAIVYGDVIEHLIDPLQSVPEHLKLVKPQGELIACIPNIQHWTIVKQLLSGDWRYENSGLLDNTHLRFFTRKSIWRMLEQLNMDLVEQQRYSLENVPMFGKRVEERDEIISLLELVNKSLGQKHSELDFRTFQYGIRAKLRI